jgi:hypothetical protein
MKISTYVASASALLALMAFKQFNRMEAVAMRQPVATTSTKGVKGTKQVTAVSDVVTAANTFLATLSTTQQSTVQQTFSSANVIRWSNFPTGIYNNRLGIRLDALTTAQRTAALAVLQAATGTAANEGYDEIQQLRAADDNLAANGGSSSSYGNGIYYLAFLGTPSTTGTWMLQFGGHHLATNITFGSGNVTGTTPKFEGVEPLSFTTTNSNVFATGTTLAPQAQEQAGMLAMINGLTTAQKATAKLSQTFGDVVVGPQKDGQFPTTKVGIQCSQLTAAQQALVVAAMAPWVNDADDATAASLLSYYQSQLADTYISYSGSGNFTSNSDYARIDGPNVWIEFSCQNGVIYQSQIHYHTIYRDRARDYGGNFYGTYTTVLGTKSAEAASVYSAYPNPVASGQGIDVVLAKNSKSATYTLRNTLGQKVANGIFSGIMTKVPTVGLSAGTYLLTVQPIGEQPVTSRISLQ